MRKDTSGDVRRARMLATFDRIDARCAHMIANVDDMKRDLREMRETVAALIEHLERSIESELDTGEADRCGRDAARPDS